MSDSVRPYRRQPTRLLCSWDSPGKNTGVGCHFLLQCMKVKSESEVAQSCPTPSDPMDRSLQGSSVHGILQARIPEWVAIAFSEMCAWINMNENRYWALTSSSWQSSRAGTPTHHPHTPCKQGSRCTCRVKTSWRPRGMQAWPLSSPGKGQSSACLFCPATASPSQFWPGNRVGAAGGSWVAAGRESGMLV